MFDEELKNLSNEPRHLRKFGLTLGAAFVALGVLTLWRGHEWGNGLFAAGAVLVGLAPLAPRAFVPIRKAWMMFGVVLGSVMTRVILGALFYLVATPLAFVARVAGKKFLDVGFDPAAKSYWHKREGVRKNREHWERQF